MKRTHRPLTVLALLLAMFMSAAEMTIVSTAMPTAVGELGGVHLYAWVFTAYMLVSTIVMPISGKLSDLYGRKPVMLAGTALFLLGSVACGLAPSMGSLIAARALQGLGAGAMQPMAMTIIGDIFDTHERAHMQGVFGAVWGFAGLTGPLLGGLIVKYLSWHWVFLINVPFALGSMVILAGSLHERVEARRHRLDLAGALTLSAAVLCVLFAARGGDARLVFLLPAAAGLGMLFLAAERRHPEPLLPLGLFSRRVMATASAAGALIGAGMFAMTSYVPLYVQGVLGGSPTQAGSVITPMAVGWPLASALAGRLLPRTGFRPLVRGGLLLTALAAVLVAILFRPGMSLNTGRLLTALFGAGLGFANTALLIAVQSSVEWRQRGVATASTIFFRTIGGTLSVGILGGVLAAALLAQGPAGTAAVQELLSHGRSGLSAADLGGISAVLQQGLGRVFWAVAAVASCSFAVSLLFPEPDVRPAAAPMPAQAAPVEAI
jgi:EmrB/QacA subfamily drug resistance transporter